MEKSAPERQPLTAGVYVRIGDIAPNEAGGFSYVELNDVRDQAIEKLRRLLEITNKSKLLVEKSGAIKMTSDVGNVRQMELLKSMFEVASRAGLYISLSSRRKPKTTQHPTDANRELRVFGE